MSTAKMNVSPASSNQPQQSFIWIYMSYFSTLFARSAMFPIIGSFVKELWSKQSNDGKMPGWVTGISQGGYFMILFISCVAFGPISNYIGRKKALLINIFGQGLTLIGQAIAPSYWTFLGARMLSGAFCATRSVGSTYIGDLAPAHDVPKYLANLGLVRAICFVGSPLFVLGLTLSITKSISSLSWSFLENSDGTWPMRGTVIISALLPIIFGFFAMFSLKESMPQTQPPSERQQDDTALDKLDAICAEKNNESPEMITKTQTRLSLYLWALMFVAMVGGICVMNHIVLIQILMGPKSDKGLNWTFVPFCILCSFEGVVNVCGQTFFRSANKKIGLFGMLAIGTLFQSIGCALIPILTSVLRSRNVEQLWLQIVVMCLPSVLLGSAMGFVETGCAALVSSMSQRISVRATAKWMGIWMGVTGVGFCTGSGVLSLLPNITHAFFLSSALAACATVIVLLIRSLSSDLNIDKPSTESDVKNILKSTQKLNAAEKTRLRRETVRMSVSVPLPDWADAVDLYDGEDSETVIPETAGHHNEDISVFVDVPSASTKRPVSA